MKKIFLLPLIATILFASNILNYNIYNRTNRVDAMFTFNTPYQGAIKEIRKHSKIILKLYNLSINAPKIKLINSVLISKLIITPLPGYTQIVAYASQNTILSVSKTADNYGLRLRFTPKVVITKTENILNNKKSINFSSLQTKQNLDIPNSYYIVIALLFIAVIILLILKRKISKKNDNKKSIKSSKNNWFFKEKIDENQNVHVRFTKKIDQNTTVTMLDYGDFNYLILNGTSNVLLDKFENNQPITDNHFDKILQEHTQEIEQLLHSQKTEEPFQAYKEKASSIAYNLDEAL